MSSTLSVYAIDLERLRQIAGSGDQVAMKEIADSQREFLQGIDEIDEETEMRCVDALAEIINGSISDEGPGYLYGYALEAICAHLGKTLPNIPSIAGATDWIDEMEEALSGHGGDVLSGLVYGGSPVKIRTPDDYPLIGSWPAEKIPTALEAMKSVDRSELEEEADETFGQIHEWLMAAAKKPGVSLVGFLA